MNEKQITRLARQGEQSAYRQLVERYQTGLIIYCENIVKDRQAAEDIAQETFVKAYYALKKYSPSKGAFSTWLYRIAANRARDYLRKHRQRIIDSNIEEIGGEHERLTSAEKQEVRDKVAKLRPPEYASVIRAYFWEGKRYEDIAREFGVPIGTISSWMNRAKQQLRKELS